MTSSSVLLIYPTGSRLRVPLKEDGIKRTFRMKKINSSSVISFDSTKGCIIFVSRILLNQSWYVNCSDNGNKCTEDFVPLMLYFNVESQLHTTCSTKVIWAESLNFLGKATGFTMDKCFVTNCPFSSGMREAIYRYRESHNGVVMIIQLICQQRYNFYLRERRLSEGVYINRVSFKFADHLPVIMSKTDSSWYRVCLKSLRYSFNVCSIGNCESVKLDFSNCYKRKWEHTIVNGRMCWKGYTDMPLSTYRTLNENVYKSRLWVISVLALAIAVLCKEFLFLVKRKNTGNYNTMPEMITRNADFLSNICRQTTNNGCSHLKIGR